MINNYPVRFALMPVYESDSWQNGGNEVERVYEINGYVASKCYLLKEVTSYDRNGDFSLSYKVAFPYCRKENNTWASNEDDNHILQNTVVVTDIFYTYDDALKAAMIKNNEILTKKISKSFFNQKTSSISDTKNAYLEYLKFLKELEIQIKINTDSMKFHHPTYPGFIVRIDGKIQKVANISVYEFMELYHDRSFQIYSVQGSRLDKAFKNCTSEPLSGDLIAYSNRGEHNIYLTNGYYLDHNFTIQKKTNAIQMEDAEVRVYTSETLEDFMISYQKHSPIQIKK